MNEMPRTGQAFKSGSPSFHDCMKRDWNFRGTAGSLHARETIFS